MPRANGKHHKETICKVSHCSRYEYARGMCSIHWSRMRRNGHLGLEKIPLTEEERKILRAIAKSKYKKSKKGKLAEKRYRSSEAGRISKRKAVKIRRKRLNDSMPKWIDRSEMIKFLRKKRPGMQIDHIHPLVIYDENGNHTACGLTVYWNLQIVPAEFNAKKRNKIMEYSPNDD